ncbi:Histone-lysine N-methyltransferase, H3 lysine-36 specific [Frankliniella fusca]|uniref:Histone-lysine N-methyltransferase, H3 lysine-36 specific n=1 Tax=Frankliniella fusca TaxID=407009 RepID=A0AAE1H5D1_9NEOP|nr:Histone-lysine N-methyltransferase, H3 lysine-36 specific [Frankliniella fusca]
MDVSIKESIIYGDRDSSLSSKEEDTDSAIIGDNSLNKETLQNGQTDPEPQGEELNSSAPQQVKIKRRRSSALNTLLTDSPDPISRQGRTRRAKADPEDFLPTDAVLGKSPKSPKKVGQSVDTIHSAAPAVDENQALKSDNVLNGSLEDSFSAETDAAGDGKTAIEDDLEETGTSEEEITTEYEPGDLIWGRIGRHPFWPCVIINDPVDKMYFKLTGHGRLSYHVLFYGDNGKRSWVASSMVLRFLGLSDFEAQAANITSEMRKSNPKLYSGFSVKDKTKPMWEIAVAEAEAVMTLTRDERLDAFLDNMRQMKGRKSKTADDSQDSDEIDEDGDDDNEGESAGSPTVGGKKKKSVLKAESSPTEKKKRGRPRKIDVSLSQTECDTPEPVAKSTPGPGRGRKRRLVASADSNQGSNGDGNNGSDSKSNLNKKRKKRKKRMKKSLDDKAFAIYAEQHVDRIIDDHPEMNEKDAEKYLRLLWENKDEDEKSCFIAMAEEDNDEASEVDEEENDGRDDTGVEEEVATVAPSDSVKADTGEETSVVISKTKINLFRGFKMERVCQNCEKPGNTVRCRGVCAGVFHVECARGADNSVGLFCVVEDEEKPKKRGRKKKVDSDTNEKNTQKLKSEKRHKKIYADEESDSDLDYANGDVLPEVSDDAAVLRMIMGDTSELPEVSMMTQEESESEEEEEEEDGGPLVSNTSLTDFRCGDCAMYRTPLCFVCGQASVPSGEDSTRTRCSVGHCGKHYHIECLKVLWPQASYNSHNGVFQHLSCPQHVCHTCVSDNPRGDRGRFSHEKLVRCIRCPTTYHYGNYCVPAGSKILTATQMICPRHYEPPKKGNHHINASWCFICSVGGSLICCDLCPSSFHVDCLKIKPPTGGYICEDCETGRFPLYNEVLWVKLGHYRWWPALSLFPSEVPVNVERQPHKMGEFAVRFLGTNDHYWIERGRCFFYHEGDCVQDNRKTLKTSMENSYQRGVLEAKELHKAHKELRAKIQSQSKSNPMKPPQYVKIKTNKPVGSVKVLEVDTSNISPCECNPNSQHPCSPDSECLNRILMVECDPNTCPAGDKCENQYFEKRIYPSLSPYWTEGRGWGLKLLEPVKKGTFIIEYVGEVIDDEEYQRRLQKKHEEKDENYYFLTIDSNRIIDAGPKGNVSRFMNHSCLPNCETQKWTIFGDTRVGLFALTDIPAGTELTFNYNLESKGNEKKPCQCGTSVCSGFIGAKKTKVSVIDSKEQSTGKKKRRKPRVRNLIEDICLICDADKEAGTLYSCINKECASKYHLTCVGLTCAPRGKWLCPRHRCNICDERTQQWCSYCTESYCPSHIGSNLVSDPLHGYICEVHQKDPLSKEMKIKTLRDEKKKREEEEKMKIDSEKKKLDTEKRKQYEAERAKRRSRREQITEEEGSKVKQSSSDIDDAASEVSINSDKSTGNSKETTVSGDDVLSEDNGSIKNESSASVKAVKQRRPWKGSPRVSPVGKSPGASKRGRKRKIVPSEESKHSLVKKEASKEEYSQRIEDDLNEINNGIKAVEDEESHISSSVLENSVKDEIPDADPALDKFIVQAPAPMDDEPLDSPDTPSSKRIKLSGPKSDRDYSNEASPGSISKRRRKLPAHNLNYTNSQNRQLKNMKESTPDKLEKVTSVKKSVLKKQHDTKFVKGDLLDELEDLAAGFASDDGLDSAHILSKKSSSRGRGKRLSLGVVRSRNADSTTGEILDIEKMQPLSTNSLKSPVGSRISPNPLKSPVGSRMSPSTLKSPMSLNLSPKSFKSPGSNQLSPNTFKSPSGGSPEKLSASKIFAMQRAKGLKVMPPNRRLSLAREQALSSRAGDDVPDKVERAGKGLKIMKGRRSSMETNSSEKKNENLHGDLPQSGIVKKVRPVLSKVEDNGVSVDDEAVDKVVENNSLPLPKTPQPNSMQSPPNKKLKPTSPKKPSPSIGVSSLWNQDILNIMN